MRSNFIRLMQNIELNKFDNIIAVPFAISDITRINTFVLKNEAIGSSGSQLAFGDGRFYLLPQISVDQIADYFDIPDYLKIDIDGQEWEVIKGALRAFAEKDIVSVLVEINEMKSRIMNYFDAVGYTTDNSFNKLENHSRIRREKEGIKAENVIFTRK